MFIEQYRINQASLKNDFDPDIKIAVSKLNNYNMTTIKQYQTWANKITFNAIWLGLCVTYKVFWQYHQAH